MGGFLVALFGLTTPIHELGHALFCWFSGGSVLSFRWTTIKIIGGHWLVIYVGYVFEAMVCVTLTLILTNVNWKLFTWGILHHAFGMAYLGTDFGLLSEPPRSAVLVSLLLWTGAILVVLGFVCPRVMKAVTERQVYLSRG